MFVNKLKMDSIAEAVKQVDEASIKIPTSTGTKVLGGSYGNSAKAHQDQTKKDIDKIKGPTTKELTGKDDKKKNESFFKDKLINNYLEEDARFEEELNEVLSKDASAGEWISDFIHSDNPKFAGKSKKKRQKMALAAYYAKQRNEETEIDEAWMKKEELKGNQKKIDKNHNNKIDGQDLAILRAQKEETELDEAAYELADGPITTDTLRGRLDGGAPNDFKSFKLRVKPLDKEGDGEDRIPKIREPEMGARKPHIGQGGEVTIKGAGVVGTFHKEEIELDEKAGYSAKAARAGKDIGKPGKAFAKIAAGAAKRYGSEEKGKKVAGAILAKLRKEEQDAEWSDEQVDALLEVYENMETPKKNTDIADKSYLKDMGKKPTVKSDLKNFKNFLTGKKETNEEIQTEAKGPTSQDDNVPFEQPYQKVEPNVKDKSGAVHTPMSRAKDLARNAMKRLKTEMLGKAPGNNG